MESPRRFPFLALIVESHACGQLDINNKRPERSLFLPPEARRQWTFVPGSTAEGRHQRDLEQQPAPPTNDGDTAAGASHDGATIEAAPKSSGSGGAVDGDAGGEGDGKDVLNKKCGKEDRGGAGSKGRKEWSRLPKEQQQETQQKRQREGLAGKDDPAPKSPDSTR